ncbi:MAG: hypothetical protein HYX72_03920 [Acidobacteria bacterium]|nr:hypothetical protein [Acidobacteriota bacterium]
MANEGVVATKAVPIMPEAEVTLRFCFWLLDHTNEVTQADVAIDGAHVRIKPHKQGNQVVEERIVFDIGRFLIENGCTRQSHEHVFRGDYRRRNQLLKIRSRVGFDVQVKVDGRKIRAECKGGPLQKVKGKSALVTLAKAVGQIVVSERSSLDDDLWVAVPRSPEFEAAAKKAVSSELFVKTGIRIALVAKTGEGLSFDANGRLSPWLNINTPS